MRNVITGFFIVVCFLILFAIGFAIAEALTRAGNAVERVVQDTGRMVFLKHQKIQGTDFRWYKDSVTGECWLLTKTNNSGQRPYGMVVVKCGEK